MLAKQKAAGTFGRMSQRLRLQGLADICSGKAAKAAKADRQAVKGLSWMEAVGGGGGRARERDKTRRDSDIHTHHTLGIPDSGKNGRGHKPIRIGGGKVLTAGARAV